MRRREFLAATAAGLTLAAAGKAAGPAPALRLELSDFAPLATGLDHAEGVAAARNGRIFITDGSRGIRVVEPSGVVRQVGSPPAPAGIALTAGGALIVANAGLLNGTPGPLQQIDPATGATRNIAERANGRTLVATNFPAVAADGSIYCTHSAWSDLRNIGRSEASGFILRVSPDGKVDVVADGLRSPNGCCFDGDRSHLYVALTAEGRICRFARKGDGSLGARQDFGPLLGQVVPDHRIEAIRALSAEQRNALGYCDGIAFDSAGNLWITLPFANKLVALTPAGDLVPVVNDPEGRVIAMPTNLAWSGADMRDLLVVSRGNGTVVKARTEAPGLPLTN